MKLKLDPKAATPVFQQFVEQVHFLINTGELSPGSKLPSIRVLADKHKLAINTVAKAMRQLEFRGLIQAQPRSGYVVINQDASIGRYRRAVCHPTKPKYTKWSTNWITACSNMRSAKSLKTS